MKAKGKQKSLPKLKAILANPNTKRCPILDEKELVQLKLLLQNAIAESKLEPRVFATQKGICLGLESSLRKINNQTSSCVFISLSIKPNYVVGLIARNAETKDKTQPVYAQPKLENFTEEIFGVQALCMVFSKNVLKICASINKWVEERKKPVRIENIPAVKKKTKKVKKTIKKLKVEKPDMITENTTKSEKVSNAWIGDFISFGNSNYNVHNSKLDSVEAVDALSEIIDKIPTSSKALFKAADKMEKMQVDKDIEGTSKQNTTKEVESSDSDDFLEEYKSLIVHKIKGNPNKNPKKKRKKNKKKNQTK